MVAKVNADEEEATMIKNKKIKKQNKKTSWVILNLIAIFAKQPAHESK